MASGRCGALHFARGCSHALDAEFDDDGTNVALFFDHAESVELAFFDANGKHEVFRAELPDWEGCIWYRSLAGVRPVRLYGYRFQGSWETEAGHHFNQAKPLLDPYDLKSDGNYTCMTRVSAMISLREICIQIRRIPRPLCRKPLSQIPISVGSPSGASTVLGKRS